MQIFHSVYAMHSGTFGGSRKIYCQGTIAIKTIALCTEQQKKTEKISQKGFPRS